MLLYVQMVNALVCFEPIEAWACSSMPDDVLFFFCPPLWRRLTKHKLGPEMTFS